MKLAKYAKYPDLVAAITNLIACRITVSLDPSANNIAILARARTLVTKTRAKYATQLHEDKIRARIEAKRAREARVKARVDAIPAKRYASQHARRSRTLDTAAETREHRQARRQLARRATEQKRADNQRAHGYAPLPSKSARTILQSGDTHQENNV